MASNHDNPLFILGQEYLLEFAEIFGSTITKNLAKKWGDDWFSQCVIPDRNVNPSNISDLSFQLKQILDLNNHNFRSAIALEFLGQSVLNKAHLTALEMVRKSRNFWAHPDRTVTLKDLHRLAFNIIAIIPSNQPLAAKCRDSLQVSDKEEFASKIASLISINKIYINYVEYRSELSIAIQKFNELSAKIDRTGASDLEHNFTSQNHLLNNLWANFLITQPLYYNLLLDSLIDNRDSRTGRKSISEDKLLELQRNLNMGEAIEFAQSFIDSYIESKENCSCGFCELAGTQKILILKEDAHQVIEDYYLAIHNNKQQLANIDDEERGRLPGVVLFIAAVCVVKGNIPAETVLNEWNYDLLNLNLDLGDQAYENDDVSNAVIRLIAIRNGVPAVEVEKWDLD
jgi:hypothetical protein